MNRSLALFLLLSFLEGASVMAAELLGAKMMAPYFGSSLYVWSAVMAITLGGLAAGYFTGGILSDRPRAERILYIILVLAGIFTVIMPFVAGFMFNLFGTLSIMPAVVLCSLVLLFPPVFLMGTVSPLIIKNITCEKLHAGRAAGTVYAVSTVGGIMATFLFGFYVIPEFGLRIPAVVTGCILGLIPAALLLKKGNTLGILLVAFVVWMSYSFRVPEDNSIVRYESEGLLGQMMVVDYPKGKTPDDGYSRWLFVNRISQTTYDPNADTTRNEETYFTYVNMFREWIDGLGQHKRVLLLGLGGGSVVKSLRESGHEVEVCELDPRMPFVARHFFSLPQDVAVTIDDARHFINTCDKKYDVIIFDTFKGEETPSHVFTQESLARVRLLLNERGVVLINGFGYWKGKKGWGMRSVYKTLLHEGWKVKVIPTAENENQRNLLFIASDYVFSTDEKSIAVTDNDVERAYLLTDEAPRFEKLNAAAALQWRRLAIYGFFSDFTSRKVPVFR